MNSDKLKIAITQGDINGIGPEVVVKSLADERITELCTPVVYGSYDVMMRTIEQCELTDIKLRVVDSAEDALDGAINIVDVAVDGSAFNPGHSTSESGAAAFDALERAVADLQSGAVDALVTAPICKDTIQSSVFTFPGHTEYLESSLGEEGEKALMTMCTPDGLRVALVTSHTPLSKISDSITKEAVAEKLRLFNNSLRRDFKIKAPRIAVLSLNPHAGENGLLGDEENEVILPAITEVRAEKILAFGPYASDGFFGAEMYRRFDGVLAMYHDQGLTPFKTIAMDLGVNFTAGLGYVRTSPDHGTGFDIAGKNLASADSMRQAIYMSIDILRSREFHDEAVSNPLKNQIKERPERRSGLPQNRREVE